MTSYPVMRHHRMFHLLAIFALLLAPTAAARAADAHFSQMDAAAEHCGEMQAERHVPPADDGAACMAACLAGCIAATAIATDTSGERIDRASPAQYRADKRPSDFRAGFDPPPPRSA